MASPSVRPTETVAFGSDISACPHHYLTWSSRYSMNRQLHLAAEHRIATDRALCMPSPARLENGILAYVWGYRGPTSHRISKTHMQCKY